MYFFHEIKEIEYFWADFIFSREKDIFETLCTLHRCLAENGMTFKFYKGNDMQLNYTLLDRESGLKWMVNLYEDIRDARGKTPRRHEYIVAAYTANFELPDYASRIAGSHVEIEEFLFMLQYNGRWILKKDTFSVVLFFCKNGVLGAGKQAHQKENLLYAVNTCKQLWNNTSPVFCWMDVSPQLYSEAVDQVSKGRVPSGAWFSISSRRVYTPAIVKAVESNSNLILDYMDDGSIFIENIKCRRGKLKYL